MFFHNEFERTIDAKQRLAIPGEIRAKLRELDPDAETLALYLVPGPNGLAWLWPEITFDRMVGASNSSLLPAEEMMVFEQFLFSQASRLELDKTGRIRLPERVLRERGFGPGVVILGVKDHLELTDPEEWKIQRQQSLATQAEIMLRARQALERTDSGGGRSDT